MRSTYCQCRLYGVGTGSQAGYWESYPGFSLAEAKRIGYKAMQFNVVVKSNVRAVQLWQHTGFTMIGEIPGAFHHYVNGLTNAYIMYKKL
ncbi:MAG: hypothetical protein ABJB86_07495 [Bacteroidota bacterium]